MAYLTFRLDLESNKKNYGRFARLYNFLNENKNFLKPLRSVDISLSESSIDEMLFVSPEFLADLLKTSAQYV